MITLVCHDVIYPARAARAARAYRDDPWKFLIIPKDYARAFCLPVRAHAHALRHCARMDADNPLLIPV